MLLGGMCHDQRRTGELDGQGSGYYQEGSRCGSDAFVKAIHDSLKKKTGKIRVADLGTFLVVHKKARTGVNPQTKTKIKIPAGNVPRFRASKSLKGAVGKLK